MYATSVRDVAGTRAPCHCALYSGNKPFLTRSRPRKHPLLLCFPQRQGSQKKWGAVTAKTSRDFCVRDMQATIWRRGSWAWNPKTRRILKNWVLVLPVDPTMPQSQGKGLPTAGKHHPPRWPALAAKNSSNCWATAMALGGTLPMATHYSLTNLGLEAILLPSGHCEGWCLVEHHPVDLLSARKMCPGM